MAKHKDLTGHVFERLTVIEFVGVDDSRLALWKCRCKCGSDKVVKGSLLTRGRVKSCGCLNKEVTTKVLRKHGMSDTAFYRVWNSMIMRCHNPNSSSFERYGAKGIVVCDRWRTFENFKNDMLPAYEQGLSLDRVDNSKGYEPGNCEWATAIQQANNTRSNRLLTYQGETLTMSEMARKYGISPHLVKRRLQLGWSIERALKNK